MTASNRIHKAFVSSTFIDLKDHRAHVITSLRNAGFFVDPMENWTAESDEPKKFSQDRLEGCHLCVLLVAFRRGFVPDGETRSITQLEYDSAVKRGIDILPFLLGEKEPWYREFDELDKDPELKKWRDHLGALHGKELFKLDPRSIDMTGALGRWLAKKTGGQSEREKIERIDWPDGTSPYRGLQWFTQEYAPLFFGRDREVDELIAKMSEPEGRAVLIIGASGSGKSSVVSAGVWQAIIKEGRLPGSAHWKWQRIQPSDGATPSEALARGLKDAFQLPTRPRLTTKGSTLCDVLARQLSHGQDLILFIDQFEELFTSGFHEPDIQSFLELLIGAAKEPIYRLRVVATIRSEFLGKLEAYESTLSLLNSPYRYHLGPVSPRMLQEMIEKPAEITGYQFEPGLVERILQDTGQEPGNLTLVEYALNQLFERRKERTFTMEAYEGIGGVVGAIATKANEVVSGLDEEVRGAFNHVFAELVHLDRERPATRRRAAMSVFNSNQAAMKLIDALAGQDCRVFVSSGSGQEATVEVAHEKLFTAWPKLQQWISENGESLREIDHAEEEAQRWQKGGNDPLELWSLSRAKNVLAAIDQFGRRPSPNLSRFLKPQTVLCEKLRHANLTHVEHLAIGLGLEEYGDPRPGVGVAKDGLPDIIWVEIPGGQVTIKTGNVVSDEDLTTWWHETEHVFTVKPFKISRYLVTNAQFDAFLNAKDGYRNRDWWKVLEGGYQWESSIHSQANCPREMVSWREAVAFCRWLSAKTGTSIRLPTEWEWQQAATGGDPTREYPWLGAWDASRCNSYESRLNRTTTVGMYPQGATTQGVLDMAGNVMEWCLNTCEHPEQQESVRIHINGQRVLRGGSWYSPSGTLRVSNREEKFSNHRASDVGFRLVQDIP